MPCPCKPTAERTLLPCAQVLGLVDNRLSGTLPTQLAQLERLNNLFAFRNRVSGTLPVWHGMGEQVGRVTKRTIQVGYNSISGTLPTQWTRQWQQRHIGMDDNLNDVRVEYNSISGTIPASWVSSFYRVKVSANKIKGTIPSAWGGEIHHSTQSELFAEQNQLSGTLPTPWSPDLQSLLLGGNRLSGTLPSRQQITTHGSMGSVPNLEKLQLPFNSISGTLPESWKDIRSLQIADLGYNRLSGTFPGGWCSMSQLLDLMLANNSLRGNVFGVVFNPSCSEEPHKPSFPSLMFADLDYNHFSGTLPSQALGQCTGSQCASASPVLYLLAAHGNALSGTLPPGLARTHPFKALDLGDNRLGGTLPPSWSSMPLHVLSLDSNDISGSLPAEWAAMAPTLQNLSLELNLLSGTVPHEWAHDMLNGSARQTLWCRLARSQLGMQGGAYGGLGTTGIAQAVESAGGSDGVGAVHSQREGNRFECPLPHPAYSACVRDLTCEYSPPHRPPSPPAQPPPPSPSLPPSPSPLTPPTSPAHRPFSVELLVILGAAIVALNAVLIAVGVRQLCWRRRHRIARPALVPVDSTRTTPLDAHLLAEYSGRSADHSFSRPDAESLAGDASPIGQELSVSYTPVSLADFSVHGFLGRGSMAKVYLVSHMRSKDDAGRPLLYALKVVKKRSVLDVARAAEENRILQTLHHPFIVSLHYAFDDKAHVRPTTAPCFCHRQVSGQGVVWGRQDWVPLLARPPTANRMHRPPTAVPRTAPPQLSPSHCCCVRRCISRSPMPGVATCFR